LNLTTMFDQFNVEYFEGALPTIPIILETRKTKNRFGMYSYRYQRQEGVSTIIYNRRIQVYTKAVEREVVPQVLFHEMLHYYLHFKGVNHGHTPLFKRYMSKFLGKHVSNRYIQL